MSIWAKTWAYEQHPKRVDSDGNTTDKKHPAAKAVLVALAEYPGPGQRVCWPSQKTLAAMTDYSERQVRACLSDLEAQGLITRTERHRKDGTRRSDMIELIGPVEAFGPKQDGEPEDSENQPEEPAGGPPSINRKRVPNQPEEPAGHEPPQRTVRKNNNSFANAQELAKSPPREAVDGSSPPASPQSESEPAVDMKRWAVAQLMEKVNAARERGAPIHDPLSSDRGQYARFFEARTKRHEPEFLLMAFDFQVAKASGQIEGEKKAWCGFDTALDRVLEGWRPANLSAADEVERERQREEDRKADEAAWDAIVEAMSADEKRALGLSA